MRPTMTHRVFPVLLAASFALPVAALAQTPGTTSPAPATAPMPHAAPMQHTAAHTGQNVTDRVEHRIAEMHSKLHITAAQQPQWDAFSAVMRDNASNMQKVVEDRVGKFTTMNAVDNMTSYEAIAQQHAADLQKLVPAFQALYASLSDEQKRAADDMFRNMAAARTNHAKAG